jgi:hypothetical protein
MSKSLGPNGWTMEVYLGFYELMEEDILRVVEESKFVAKVIGSLNLTFVALIPMKNNPKVSEDYMPIYLCNTIHNIIAKVITSRLRKIFQTLLDKNNLDSYSIEKFMMQ